MKDYKGRIILNGEQLPLSDLQIAWTPAVGHEPARLSQLNDALQKLREEQVRMAVKIAVEGVAEQCYRRAWSPPVAEYALKEHDLLLQHGYECTNEFTLTGPVVDATIEHVE